MLVQQQVVLRRQGVHRRAKWLRLLGRLLEHWWCLKGDPKRRLVVLRRRVRWAMGRQQRTQQR